MVQPLLNSPLTFPFKGLKYKSEVMKSQHRLKNDEADAFGREK
jgi:hypothetical protein